VDSNAQATYRGMRRY